MLCSTLCHVESTIYPASLKLRRGKPFTIYKVKVLGGCAASCVAYSTVHAPRP